MRSDTIHDTFYFCLELTENEHYIVGDMIDVFCLENGYVFHYYRKLSDGHVPMLRECKVEGKNINRFKAWMIEEKLQSHWVPNPHRTRPEECPLVPYKDAAGRWIGHDNNAR